MKLIRFTAEEYGNQRTLVASTIDSIYIERIFDSEKESLIYKVNIFCNGDDANSYSLYPEEGSLESARILRDKIENAIVASTLSGKDIVEI
jgi:hypothetical protein